MKVKVGQLKTHLSSYLREIQETGEPIEVCVRETAVAYLSPLREKPELGSRLSPETISELRKEGIEIVPAKQPKDDWLPEPGKAGDGLHVENTIVAIRKEKDW